MENSADLADQASEPNAVDLHSPDPKVVRRRFVQTTLFPLKPHDTKVEDCAQKEVKKVEETAADGEEAEEISGSQGGKRRRGRKPKGNTTPQKRGSKKVIDAKVEEIDDDDDDDEEEACGSQGRKRGRGKTVKGNTTPQKRGSKKAAVNGKDASVVEIDNIESPDDASPQQLKAKQRVSTRNGRTNGNKATSMSKVSTHPVATLQSSQPVPDLWLEAKKTAEENSRIFAGKQIHPFFSSWKAGKKDMETIELENNGCLDKRKEKNVELGPVHVFDNVMDDLDYIDWSNWTFDDRIFSKTTCNVESKFSCFEGLVGSLNFDALLRTSNPSLASLLPKDVSLSKNSQLCGADENSSVQMTSICPIVVDEELTPYDPLKNLEKDFEVTEPCISGNVGYISSHLEQQFAVPQERLMAYYLNRGNYPENSLWTNKYHPEKAVEVCGNSEAVKFINEWLRLWHEKDFRFSKSSYSADKCTINEDEYDSDSDFENIEASGLKNVLLVTGPVGSGKSAAIYACAKEQGFQVIEVNASDWRNGALLKQKFGEAVGSHWLKRSQESPMGKLHVKSTPVISTGAAAQDLNNGVVEVISLSEEEDYGNVGSQYLSNSQLSCDKGDIKTLILFEDVDVTLCDDRGFISTIQQLADTGKRPMILTSNNESPPLPDNLDREEVCFTMPSLKELAHHIHLVCFAEKSSVQPNLIERCIEFCKGDIRKTLMHLQFWCQSKECIKGGRMKSMSCPLMFNLEAGHCILPKLIPWALPSLLSEFVEAEVAKSFCKMEENHSMLGLIEEEEVGNICMEGKMSFNIDETASIEAKKEAILSGNCFLHVDNDVITGSNPCEFSNSSGSPVAFARRNIHRKSDTVLSESEDEICNLETAVSDCLPGDDNDTSVPGVHSQFPVLHFALEGISNEFGGLHHGAKEVESARHQSSDTAHASHFNLFDAGNLCKQSTDPFVHSEETKHQHLEFVNGNCCSKGVGNDSLNLFHDLPVHTQDENIEANICQLPVVDHEKLPTAGNYMNQSAYQPFHFGDVNVVKIDTENADNMCLNPSSNQLQHCSEEKNSINGCLFTLPTHADPISHTICGPRNQSTGQLIQCIEKASMEEPQHWHLEVGTLNYNGPLAADASLRPSFDQLLCSSKDNVGNSEQQHPETANANPFCYTALGDSLNPSNDQLFHFVEAKEKEIQHQHPETSNRSANNCATVDGPFLQLSNQFLGTGKAEKIQQQHPQIPDVNYTSLQLLDDSLKLTSGQLHREEEKAESIQHRLPDMDIVDLASYPAVDISRNTSDVKTLNFIEPKFEEQQCQYSDATNVNHVIDQCPSVDFSYVPESTFVPETEVNDGTECPSGTDMMEIVSPVAFDNANPSILVRQSSEYGFCGIDINVDARDEEMGDSQSENEHLEPSTSGCPVMDECSRMDFYKRSKSFRKSALAVNSSVQKRWNELRQIDLGQYNISEHKNALQLVELGSRMSNLISEGDLLLHDYELLNDLSGLEESFSFGWHDQQVQMAISIAQYGYLLYAKDIDALQSKMGLSNKLHLGWEMLVSTNNSMTLGKLLSLNRNELSSAETSIKQAPTAVDISSTRKREMCLQNVVQSLVPLRSYLTVRGCALRDYLSSLSHISRTEASRLAEATEKPKKRRVRVTKNYLSSGGLDLSQDDISKLNEYKFYRRDSSK